MIVSLRGRPGREEARLAEDLGITVLSPGEVEQFFSIDVSVRGEPVEPAVEVAGQRDRPRED